MGSDRVVVASFGNDIDAELAKGRLESSGVAAMIVKDDAGGMFPSLQSTAGVKLMVSRNDEKKALDILNELSE
ncbi:MAG TPA: DUF2007 domain-containing protein [Bacteroidota bacterium]|nr:DUF2007 domain-containing protein [Bacteroidota bacterium]